jgi:flavin reductase (DIM6/NTAB) family NADH-FMN oxidoreductase RutF
MPYPTEIDPRQFRNTLGRFATGITVVTIPHDGEVHGITVNAFMSVSLEPPLVVISIGNRARAHQLLLSSTHYGVSVLNERQIHESNRFAGRPAEGRARFVTVHGFPLLPEALAHLICRITERYAVGDHTLFVGQVEHLAWQDDQPLLYFASEYAQLQSKQSECPSTS